DRRGSCGSPGVEQRRVRVAFHRGRDARVHFLGTVPPPHAPPVPMAGDRAGDRMNPRKAAAVLAIAFAVVSVFSGLRTGNKVLDTDEAVYQHTLREMRAGRGYYRAMSDALVIKEGARPDSVRAIRPPTEFLLLRWLPEKSWRWVVGIVYLAVLIGLARLGEPYGPYGSLV